jgi:hypothetical protein
MAKTFLFCGFLILHWILQFLAWSFAEHDVAMRVCFRVLATPFLLINGRIANEYFWLLATANSVLWATVLLYVFSRYVWRRS